MDVVVMVAVAARPEHGIELAAGAGEHLLQERPFPRGPARGGVRCGSKGEFADKLNDVRFEPSRAKSSPVNFDTSFLGTVGGDPGRIRTCGLQIRNLRYLLKISSLIGMCRTATLRFLRGDFADSLISH
jgi:hypothetical protein